MARPKKTGLDYFPMDTHFDDDIELFEAEEGLEGLGVLLKIWQKIYKEGYFIEWKDDNELLFSKKINSEKTRVNSIINCCIKRNIFDKGVYEKHKVLTSRGIQKRFLTACKTSKRSFIPMVKQYRLVNSEYNEVITEETSVISEETISYCGVPTEESTQKKGKEKKEKVKENKEEIYRNQDHLSITVKEAETLKQKYKNVDVDDYIDKVFNYNKNKKYTSLYLTVNSWIKKDKDNYTRVEKETAKRKDAWAEVEFRM